MLLGGKGAAGVMQLGTFALAARGLGLEGFGTFSVLIAQVMVLTGLAAFDTNQAIIRYGVGHLASGDRPAIQGLFKAGTLLDFGAATLAALATILIAPFIGRRLGWGPDLILMAQCIAPLSFANAYSTPKGMLRLFNRFDLLTAYAVVTPAMRLILIGVLTLLHLGLGWYLAAWLVAGMCGEVTVLWMAWREAHRRELLGGLTRSLRALSAQNPGVWRFSIVSNLHSSLSMIPTQLAVVLVGWKLGEAAAGLFRIARETGTGMMKPVDLVNQAVYPDMTRLVQAGSWRRLTRTAVRAGLAAGAIGAALTAAIWLAGDTIVSATFGKAYVGATPVLIAVCAATSLRVLAFAADPVMYAFGRPSVPLRIAAVSSGLFVLLMLWRLPLDGLIGAGWAFMGMSVVGALLSTVFAVRMVRRAATGKAEVPREPVESVAD
ncbi:Membrane protein involved in the export of O-antigen and teichoic acid [Sphingomonas jatrophae]|uniref:Membrane protein involved in the export of O-antigen and teichoic acid n=2 Tax=Sphingomonas jatrophae TaxID=1166337 RepID=A0A1I6JT63_9SPHN|nr:Membrane protein involved in the export of O-antigen and teichoic acid [Sphingomonas jatrophae]